MRKVREDDSAADVRIEPKRARRNARGTRVDRATAASVTKSGAGRATRKRPAGAGAKAGKATGTTHRGGAAKRGRATANARGGKAQTRTAARSRKSTGKKTS
jgi:hypothetical protein